MDFWQFVHERQTIWHRRNILGEFRPWTSDPVLERNFFTNVFRELDPGTWVAADIVKRCRPGAERLWNLILYRRLNREDTWRALGGYGSPQLLGKLLEKLLRKIDGPVFTGAHQVHTMQGIISGRDAIARQAHMMRDLGKSKLLHGLAHDLFDITSVQQAFELWREAHIPGVGDFLSWQLALDCRYGLAEFSDDEWAPVQAGCRAGLEILYPGIGAKKCTSFDREYKLLVLRDTQDAEFRARGLDFQAVAAPGHGRLTVAAIEHSLCEYSKYVRISSGGHSKGKF